MIIMREISLSEETFREIIKMKNFWSFQFRGVTNPKVLEILQKMKHEVFGYDDRTPAKEIEKIANSKPRKQLEEEMEKFNKGLNELLLSGFDFEPEYTLDMHIDKMIELIDNSEELNSPVF